MTRSIKLLLASLIGLGSVSVGVPVAQAADLSHYSGDPGVCGEAWVLNKISRRFAYQVRNVPHLPNVQITDFRRINERRYLPAEEDWPIGRRYCDARVALSDGRERTIWYLIEEGQGFAGIGDNVEFCVSGFDRWMVYDGACRILR